MQRRKKQPKRVSTDESVTGAFTTEELQSRLDLAMREALSVAERHRTLTPIEARAEEQLQPVNGLSH